jgi:EmrB/QacA subfamily drug resistance transporter
MRTSKPRPAAGSRALTRGMRSRWFVLATLCLATFTINVDTTIVNVALPSLVRELRAGNGQLQWVVDAYNLAFAALVLAAGSLSDRYGRRGALLLGLGIFGLASLAGAAADSSDQLIMARAVMGVGAATIFPATLSILSNVFTDRATRAKAIGIWGATTGVGVALGPITGGWLLERFWWGSVFLAMVPLAAAAAILTAIIVPTSRDPATPRLDIGGLVLSTAGLGALVYTIIEAPQHGWASTHSLLGFVVAALLLAGLVGWERRVAEPMIDVRLFANLRFSAASGSVTVAFFALAGFIFVITQYFQFLRAYGPLETGLRMLPVAGAIAAGSLVGTKLAVRAGTKSVVTGGLVLLGSAFLWISTASAATPYSEIIGQMVLLGAGLGLTSAPATESIMDVVPKEKAGVGSAVNDATRELGATLGVAVIGSVFASLYTRTLDSNPAVSALPAEVHASARQSIGSALIAAQRMAVVDDHGAGAQLVHAATSAFFAGPPGRLPRRRDARLRRGRHCCRGPSRPGAANGQPVPPRRGCRRQAGLSASCAPHRPGRKNDHVRVKPLPRRRAEALPKASDEKGS